MVKMVRVLALLVGGAAAMTSLEAEAAKEEARRLSSRPAVEECPRCDTFHNFVNGIVGSVVAPDSLKVGDKVCLKGQHTPVDVFDGKPAPFHFACYKMEGGDDKCPSDATPCTYAGLPKDTCECTHFKNGASGHLGGRMCVTAYGMEHPNGQELAVHDTHTTREGIRVCELPNPKLPFEERFGASVGGCQHPALPCESSCTCIEECRYSFDGDCDDGGVGAEYSYCKHGADCEDCGERCSGSWKMDDVGNEIIVRGPDGEWVRPLSHFGLDATQAERLKKPPAKTKQTEKK